MAIELVAEPRAELGKEKMKKLRNVNRLPANMYGKGLDTARTITLDLHKTEMTFKSHSIKEDYIIVLEGKSYPVKIQEVRAEPIYKHLLHIDFLVRADA
jgi:large subunit ribosomal protein L25